jgi:dienelactone hydrolase
MATIDPGSGPDGGTTARRPKDGLRSALGFLACGALVLLGIGLMASGFQRTEPPPAQAAQQEPAVPLMPIRQNGVISPQPEDNSVEPKPDAAPRVACRTSTGEFKSGDAAITVEQFAPLQPGKYPGVVILHGYEGLITGPENLRAVCRALTARGYVAFLLHYFDRTGTETADGATVDENFWKWMRTVNDAVAFAGKQKEVAPDHIGLVGYAGGAWLALSVAATNPAIAAVVDYNGDMPRYISANMTSMPPTLILHGAHARLAGEADHLQRVFKKKNVIFECKLYEGQGHPFTGAAAADADERTWAFLDKHLKKAQGKATVR